jgi:hypothetical protein
MCDVCRTVHNDLEECDGPWCGICGMEAVDGEGDVCDDCADEDEPDEDPALIDNDNLTDAFDW